MRTNLQDKRTVYALWSLASVEALALLTSIHHVFKFGPGFLVMGLILVTLPLILIWQFSRKPNTLLAQIYGLVVIFMVLGFGLFDGLWNHTIKMLLFFAYGANQAVMREKFPVFDPVGGFGYELSGVLTFVAALVAAYFTYQFIRTFAVAARRTEAYDG